MKIFLSWSGDLSKAFALAFKEWLPFVLQYTKPWVSSEDIDKGARWTADLSKELEDTIHGIAFITKDNMDSPWVNFEAGALSKIMDKSRVCPLLINVKRVDVNGPLLMFQSCLCEKEEIRKLVQTINSFADERAIDKEKIIPIFDHWWPKLKEEMKSLLADYEGNESGAENNNDSVEPDRNTKMLEEMLELMRIISKKESISTSRPKGSIPPYNPPPCGEVLKSLLKIVELGDSDGLEKFYKEFDQQDVERNALYREFIQNSGIDGTTMLVKMLRKANTTEYDYLMDLIRSW
jgi:TIR domain